MSYGNFDYFSDLDDFIELHKPYKIGDKLDDKAIAKTKSNPTVISYAHINMANNNYGFGQKEFDNKDAMHYLSRMQLLSLKSIIYIKDKEKSEEWHLNPTRGRNISAIIKKYFRVKKYVVMPEIFHFALYPKDEQKTADRKLGIKNPRVHFIIGENGIIYPLFYDPYHEINP